MTPNDSDLHLSRVLGDNMQAATLRIVGLLAAIAVIGATLVWLVRP